MFHRVLAGGQLLLYEPAAIVFHQHRRTLAELESQMYDHGSQWSMMMSAPRGRARLDRRCSLGAQLVLDQALATAAAQSNADSEPSAARLAPRGGSGDGRCRNG